MYEQWLEDNAPGFGHLSADERRALSAFLMLWSLFEAQALETRASARSICEVVERWGRDRIPLAQLMPILAHFQNRYCKNGQFTHLFRGLNFRGNDYEDLVADVLRGANESPLDQVRAVLIIVYRLRNNLFHGLKWEYGLAGQRENFEQANLALMLFVPLGAGR